MSRAIDKSKNVSQVRSGKPDDQNLLVNGALGCVQVNQQLFFYVFRGWVFGKVIFETRAI